MSRTPTPSMSISQSATETLANINRDHLLTNQTLSFGGQSINVNKSVIAANSRHFRNLWFASQNVKAENPLDLSDLDIDGTSFFDFVRSLCGIEVNVTDTNAYQLYYLAYRFQVSNMINKLESLLPICFKDWTFFKKFLLEVDDRKDFDALEFLGIHIDSVRDISLDDIPHLRTQTLMLIAKHCRSNQAQAWFIKCVVELYHVEEITVTKFSDLLDLATIKALSFQEWELYLFHPLEKFAELKTFLMEFHFSKMKKHIYDELLLENQQLKSMLHTQSPPPVVGKSRRHQAMSGSLPPLKQSKSERSSSVEVHDILFSNVLIHPDLQVSDNQKKAFFCNSSGSKHLLGAEPLSPGYVYKWRMASSTHLSGIAMGVIERSLFDADDRNCSRDAHCYGAEGHKNGCLKGNCSKWKRGTVIGITVDLIEYTLVIRSVNNRTISLLVTCLD
ncbi:hypothetical protein GEMRC1_012070 [Eukaryota sp. GEM-RC1]